MGSNNFRSSAKSDRPWRHLERRESIAPHPALSVLIRATLFTILAFATSVAVSNQKGAALEESAALSILIVVLAIAELVALWNLIWASLALFATWEKAPSRLRESTTQAIQTWGTRSARKMIQRTAASGLVASTIVTGGALVATASEQDIGVDYLWDSGVQTQMLSIDPDPNLEAAETETEINIDETISELTPSIPVSEPAEDANEVSIDESTEILVQDQDTENQLSVPLPAPDFKDSLVLKHNFATGKQDLPPNEKPAAPTSKHSLENQQEKPASSIEVPSVGKTNTNFLMSLRAFTSAKAVASKTSAGTSEPAPVPSEDRVTISNTLMHTVQPGESLWAIASTHLDPGATNHEIESAWRSIYALNIDTIGINPDLIEIGLCLEIPVSLGSQE